MLTSPLARTLALPGAPPEEILRAFRAAYPLEEVQAELWRCLHPHLLASFRELAPESPEQLAAFYESLELLLTAVYALPVPGEAALSPPETVPPNTGSHG